MKIYRIFSDVGFDEVFVAEDKDAAEKYVAESRWAEEVEGGEGSVDFEEITSEVDESISKYAEIYGTKSFHESYKNKALMSEVADEIGMEEEDLKKYFEEDLFQLDKSWDRDNHGKELNDSAFGKKAWELNEIISSMNNEEAYYGGWLYIWPDGESYEDCQHDFAKEEDYKELEEEFIKVYKAYHEDGLWTDDESIVEAAHKWDEKLGLNPIEDMYAKYYKTHSKDEEPGEVQIDEYEEDRRQVYVFESPVSVTTQTGWEDQVDTDANAYINEIKEALNDDEDSQRLADYTRGEVAQLVEEISLDVKHGSGENATCITTVITNRSLNEEEIEKVKDYLIGQFADGWGEGFEQHSIYDFEDDIEYEDYDEEEGEYYRYTEKEAARTYAHFWSSRNWDIKLVDR